MKCSKKRLAILKNKKGFTLVELIAVIVLLAIVSTIGSLSISSISGSVKTRQKNNLISSLKVQAKKYVNETGMKKVYVDTLIKEGYIQSDKIDNPDQIIVDPTDSKKTLNCYYFDFTSNEDGVISTEANENALGECNTDIFLDSTLNIKYCDKASCTLNEYQNFYTVAGGVKWIRKGTIKLRAITGDSNVISQSEVDNEAIWTTPLAPDVNTKTSEYELVAPNGYLEATYRVTTSKTDKDYVATQLIKMDVVIPTITNVRVENADEWKQEKHIYADFEDKESGLAGYIITNKKETPSESAAWQSISGKLFNLNTNSEANNIHANGTYYIYVKDIAGNVTEEPAEITIEKIDTTAPECVHTGDNTEWTNVEVEITWGCKYDVLDADIESPCTEESTQVISYKDMVTKTYTYTISDEAGNTKECKNQVADIYSDMVAPTCTNSGDSKTWTNSSRTIYYGCEDGNDLSKCNPDYSGGSMVFDTTNPTATIPSYIIKDNAGNSVTCPARTADVYVDTTKPSCTNSGDSTSWTKNNRTIYYSCADDDSGCNASFSGGSVVFNRTTKTSQIDAYKIKDNAGNETTCSKRTANVYVDKTAPTCTNSGDSTSWTNGNRTIYYGCSDGDSGCNVSYSGGSATFTTTTKTSDIAAYTIKDNAGNEKTCNKRTANVYVDKTSPTVSTFSISTRSGYSYNSMYASYSITGSDNESGISSYCITSSNDSSTCSWSNTKSSSIQFGSSEGTGSSYTRYAFVKDKAGNVSAVKSASYTLYTSCSSTNISSYGSWGSCSAPCGGGTQYRTEYRKDSYLGTTCASTTGSQSCNTQSCCSKVTYSDGSSCSASCDGGTYNRLAYSEYDGSRCSAKDEAFGGSSCNTQACYNSWWYYDDDDDDYSSSSNTNTCTSACCSADDCISKMQSNSESWHSSDSGKKDDLHVSNSDLAEIYNSQFGGNISFDSASGYWNNSDGSHAYEVKGGKKS